LKVELAEKVARYEVMLRIALEHVEVIANDKTSTDLLAIAKSYYEDGCYFQAIGDLVNALVCFSYGHGWLDARERIAAFRFR
jgi:hypothetical protein